MKNDDDVEWYDWISQLSHKKMEEKTKINGAKNSQYWAVYTGIFALDQVDW